MVRSGELRGKGRVRRWTYEGSVRTEEGCGKGPCISMSTVENTKLESN